MIDTLCVILGGGRGTRLHPLTNERSKPAVPFAGKYRLIDIPISNCLNSGLNKIYVLTQFNSESLNKHIARTFKLDSFSKGFVEIMAAEQSMENTNWFQGTADAVRQSLKHFGDPLTKRILILSGDQLYKLNFRELLDFHNSRGSQITIACNPITTRDSSDYGIIGIDSDARITRFVEKPEAADQIDDLKVSMDSGDFFLASMGIYLFEKDVLVELLTSSDRVDFGKEIIPDAIKFKTTNAYTFKGYWVDVGTMKAFYDSNLMLTDPIPKIDMFDEYWPFFTRERNLPPAKVESATIKSSIVCDGSIVGESDITHSVIGLRARIGRNSKVEDSIVMGCDYYETLSDMDQNIKHNVPSMGIGDGCLIKQAIIDKNARIGNNVKIVNKKNMLQEDGENFLIRDGIVIITKNALIPDNTVI